MSDLLNQLPALIGVVLGGVLSYGVGALTERSRWRRLQASRWDDRSLQAYADYGAAVKLELRLCLRMATSLGLATFTSAMEVELGIPLLAEAEDRRSQLFENVLLLGTPQAIEAARRWQEAISDLHRTLEPAFDGGEEGFLATFHAAGVARDHFYHQARAQLQVQHPVARQY